MAVAYKLDVPVAERPDLILLHSHALTECKLDLAALEARLLVTYIYTMAAEGEPEIWEDLEKLNLNGLKPATPTVVTPKPSKSCE